MKGDGWTDFNRVTQAVVEGRVDPSIVPICLFRISRKLESRCAGKEMSMRSIRIFCNVIMSFVIKKKSVIFPLFDLKLCRYVSDVTSGAFEML